MATTGSMALPKAVEKYDLAWKRAENVQFDLQKLDHIWRVLKYGERRGIIDGYYHVRYDDSNLVICTDGPSILGAYIAEKLPKITYSYNKTDHAVDKMVERRITTGTLRKALEKYIYYDRLGHYKWKIMSVVEGEKIFIVADTKNERIVTMWKEK